MYICEAAIEAKKIGRTITREKYRDSICYLPTNSTNCVLAIVYNKYPQSDSIKPRWNPAFDDLVADDWIVVD